MLVRFLLNLYVFIRGLFIFALNGVFTIGGGLSIVASSYLNSDIVSRFTGLFIIAIGLLQAIAVRLVHLSHDSQMNTAIIRGVKLPIMVVSSSEPKTEEPA